MTSPAGNSPERWPAPATHPAAGKSLVAFGLCLVGSAVLHGLLGGEVRLDCVVLVVLGLGVSVRSGSRAAVKWSIALMVYYVLLLATATLLALGVQVPRLRVDQRVFGSEGRAWRMAESLLFAAWGVVNVVLLIRSLRSLPRPLGPDGRPRKFQFTLRALLLWMIPLALLFGVIGHIEQQRRAEQAELRRWGADVASIEKHYAGQIAHLEKLATALSGKGPSVGTGSGNPTNVRLLAPEEILEVMLWCDRHTGIVLARKPRYQPERTRTLVGGRVPRVGEATASVLQCTLEDGSEITLVEYRATLLNAAGREGGYSMTFDLELLKGKAAPSAEQQS